MPLSRREFVNMCIPLGAGLVGLRGRRRESAAASDRLPGRPDFAGAIGALPSSLANIADELIVDTHQHLWDRSVLSLPWLEGAPEVLRPSYLPADYSVAAQGLNIHAVYMEVDVAEGQHDREVEWVAGVCRSGDAQTRAAVVGGRPESPLFADYVKRLPRDIVKGVRRVLHGGTPAGWCLRAEFVRGVRWLGDRGLSFDLCLRPTELADAVTLTRLCPETRFVVDHCGNADVNVFVRRGARRRDDAPPGHDPDDWRRQMERLAAQPNTICKISGIVAQAPAGCGPELLAPVVNHCLDAFGPDRVVFGSDWPVCLLGAPLRAWVDALRTIIANRPAEARGKLWSGNALRQYGLPAPAAAS